MSIKITSKILPSEDIVAREVAGELIIVPLVAGIGDMEDELFTFNETGKEIWSQLDGKKTLEEIIHGLAKKYSAPQGVIQDDVLGLAEELLKRRIVIAV
jgi:hypothetical protein